MLLKILFLIWMHSLWENLSSCSYDLCHIPYVCCACAHLLSCVRLFVTPWTVARQAPLSMGFSRQEYWSGLPCPSPGDFPNPGIKPTSLVSPALAGGFLTTSATWEAPYVRYASVQFTPKSPGQSCYKSTLD